MKEAKEAYLPCNKSEATNYLDDEGDLLPVKKVKAIILEENEESSQDTQGKVTKPFCDAMGHYGGTHPNGICPKCGKEWDLLASQSSTSAPVATLACTSGNSIEQDGGYYYELFKFFSDEHGLTLVDTEMQDIIHAVNKFQNEKD